MKELIEIPEDVLTFNEKCYDVIGAYAAEQFGIEIFNRVQDYRLSSPIEQLFLAAFEVLRTIRGCPEREECKIRNECFVYGTEIECQQQIGPYRVDFLIRHQSLAMARNNERAIDVIVECDGHKFHEKTEVERRYEKKRDRYFQKLGIRIFHFTGAEIVKDPFTPAAECFSFVTGEDMEEILVVLGEYLNTL